MADSSPIASLVAVHLLDPTFDRPVKSWRFADKNIITVGRSDDRDVEISDPYVSRNHAELHFREGQWFLVSRGRNGVIVKNQAIDEVVVTEDVNFRLGPNGPALRFQISSVDHENSRTLCFDTLPVNFFGIDRRKVQREVEEITDGDYFQTLQERAESLRRQRESRST